MRSTGQAPAAALPSSNRVTRDANGKYRIHELPIFVEHDRVLADGRVVRFGLPWIKQAALNMNERAASQSFRPSVHLGHHDPASRDERPSVGVFEHPLIRRAIYDGKPKWVAFSDVVVDSLADLEALKKYRYRSVEINNFYGEPKFDGLALLQSRAPYFKFPNLELDTSSIGLAYEADGGPGAAFFWPTPLELTFSEESMLRYEGNGNGSAPAGAPGASGPASGDSATPPWAQQLVSKMDQLLSIFAPPAAQPGAQPGAPVMQANAPSPAPIQAQEAPVDQSKKLKLEKKLQKTQKELAKLGQQMSAPGAVAVSYAEPLAALTQKVKKLEKKLSRATVEAPASAAPTPASAALKPSALAYADSIVSFAKKALDASQTKVKARDEALQWAETELRDRPTGDAAELRQVLTVQYEQGGRPALEGAVRTLQAMLPSLPGPAAHADARVQTEDPAVLAYSDDPGALEIARGVKTVWEQRLPAHRHHTLENWLDSEPALAGKKRPAAGAKG